MDTRFKLLRTLTACLLLAGALFSGCATKPAATAKPAETTAPAAAETAAAPDAAALEPYQIDWLFLNNGHDDRISVLQDAVNKLLKDKINATVKFNLQGWADHIAKVDTLIASGEKVDLVFTAQWWGYLGWVQKGYFLPLNDLMKQYAPETIKLLGEDVFIAGSAVSGVNYAVPTLKETCVPEGIVFNKAYLDKYGWDKNAIKKVADLEPWLAAIKANEPADVIPYLYAGRWADTPFTSIGISDDLMVYTDGRDTKVHLTWETPEMKERLALARKWYLSGYFHPDVGTTAYDETVYFKSAQFFANPQGVKGENVRADELQGQAPEGTDYVDITFEDTRYVNTAHMSGSMQAIPVTSADPARTMMFLELLHTDAEIVNLLAFGIEGTNYTMTETPGIIRLNAESSFQEFLPQWMLGNVYLQYITTNEDPTKNEKLKASSENAKINFTTGFFFDGTPVEAELAAVGNIRTELDSALCCGLVDPDEKLPEMVAKLKEAGIEKIQAEAQKQLDAWLAKTGKE